MINCYFSLQTNASYYYVDVWSSKYTWGGLDPPIEGDFVIVPAGQTLLLDVDTPILSMLLIEGKKNRNISSWVEENIALAGRNIGL